jgi:glycosyltransferase involved in cell wall biosynthesis
MESDSQSSLGRLLIFIVAYNAERTIESVLKRIPLSLTDTYDVEILIIDDSSQDNTFIRSELARRSGIVPFKMTVLFNPINQGYGGNQKIGFHYAVKNGFDWVALVHGDGQYAPECLPDLTQVLAENKADAVFGSRMMEGNSALKGGMPLYKFAGNKILTRFQNMLLGSNLSEFHSGYRLYSISALEKIPFDLNSNDFHFDTEIIIQLITAGLHIKELPIPTFYGDEICHVNGMKYAWDVCRTTMQSRIQKFHVFYDRKFDCAPEQAEDEPRFEPFSVEAVFADDLTDKANILVMGKVSNELLSFLESKNHQVTVYEKGLLHSDITDCGPIDYLVILDDSDLSQRPGLLVSRLKNICQFQPDVKLVLAVGNIGFFLTRLLLLFGRFSYTKRGIISLNHLRFFTLASLKKLLSQNGFAVERTAGVPIQYRGVFKSRFLIALFSKVHNLFCKLRPSLFAYQLVIVAKANPTLDYLLTNAVEVSDQKQSEIETSPRSE